MPSSGFFTTGVGTAFGVVEGFGVGVGVFTAAEPPVVKVLLPAAVVVFDDAVSAVFTAVCGCEGIVVCVSFWAAGEV